MAKRRLNIIETAEEVNGESVKESIAEIRTEENTPVSKIAKETPKEEKLTVNVDGYLRVRRGPGLEYEVEKQLPNGFVVTVIETNGEWAKIGPNLWVMKKFLK